MAASTHISGIGDLPVKVYLDELYPEVNVEEHPVEILDVLVDVHGVTIEDEDINFTSVDNIRVEGGHMEALRLAALDVSTIEKRLSEWFGSPEGQGDLYEALEDAADTYL